MSKPIEVFAQECDQMFGRGFTNTEYELDSGHLYNSIYLFESRGSAQADLDSDIEDELIEPDDFFVVALTLHPDGSLFDGAGFDIITHVAQQLNQTEEQARGHLKGYYQETERKLRHAADASRDGPSR